jgi:hypothetical protein
MNTEEVIQVIATSLDVPDLRLNEHGCARLRIDDGIDVNFEASEASHLLHVYSALGPVPSTQRENIFEQLLSANLFGADTGGATLAIDTEFNEIVLCMDLGNHGWTSELIMARLQRFIDAAVNWKDRFAARQLEAAAQPSAGLPLEYSGSSRY